jgi:hypothetical protein
MIYMRGDERASMAFEDVSDEVVEAARDSLVISQG